ncbi:arginase family protein [Pseudonocardia charpentierae]|uniref:arginase family protein n=1 Tax=Pseudonocardia charpentierae TaxID=3075545 RepID=UPI0037C85D9E
MSVDAVAEALPEGPVHLHVDADVVDPGDLPGLRYPASAGPRLPQVLSAVRAVLSTVPVVAVTVGCTWRGAGTPQFAALVREIAESPADPRPRVAVTPFGERGRCRGSPRPTCRRRAV